MPDNNGHNKNDSFKPLSYKDPSPAGYGKNPTLKLKLPSPTVKLKPPSGRSSDKAGSEQPIEPSFLLRISPNIKTVLPGDAANFTVHIRGTCGIYERLSLALKPGLPKVPGEVSLSTKELLVRGGIASIVSLHVQTRTDSTSGIYPISIEVTQKVGNRGSVSLVVQAQVQIVQG